MAIRNATFVEDILDIYILYDANGKWLLLTVINPFKYMLDPSISSMKTIEHLDQRLLWDAHQKYST